MIFCLYLTGGGWEKKATTQETTAGKFLDGYSYVLKKIQDLIIKHKSDVLETCESLTDIHT